MLDLQQDPALRVVNKIVAEHRLGEQWIVRTMTKPSMVRAGSRSAGGHTHACSSLAAVQAPVGISANMQVALWQATAASAS